jgi:predicted ATPase
MARLDRLGSAKELAQIGAAIGREFSHALLAAVARKPQVELDTALDRLIGSGLLFRQGAPPHARYLFKHALVQDAAYGTLLRAPRRALHARIAEAIEIHFVEIAESQPELLARHATDAGRTEKAAALWGKAGLRSLERSALVEAAQQLTRALDAIAILPPTPSLRREQIKLQVALANALMHVKGYGAAEPKAAAERARVLIEQAQALGEPPEDPLLLFSVLYGFWVGNLAAFDGDVCCALAAECLALAEKQDSTVARVVGHYLMGLSLLYTGDIAQGRAEFDRGVALYDPAQHRPLATRFGQDVGVAILSRRPYALWSLGYPQAALADTERAIKEAREIGHVATLFLALSGSVWTNILCGDYAKANAQLEETAALADDKRAVFWKTVNETVQGCLLALTGQPAEAVQKIGFGIAWLRSGGSTLYAPLYLSCLAWAHAELGQFDEAQRFITEAIGATDIRKEKWWEADRIAGEIALRSPAADAAKAQACFERALTVARAQQAKSWELRAAMSMARLFRDQGKRAAARELLAPIYASFTEGFDTLDLKQAKALLDEVSQ